MQVDMHNDLCQFKIECVYVNMLLFYKYAKMKGCHSFKYSGKISYYKPLPEGNLVKKLTVTTKH